MPTDTAPAQSAASTITANAGAAPRDPQGRFQPALAQPGAPIATPDQQTALYAELDAKAAAQATADDEGDDAVLAGMDLKPAANDPPPKKPAAVAKPAAGATGKPKADAPEGESDTDGGADDAIDPTSIPEMFRQLAPRDQFTKARAALFRTGLFEQAQIDAMSSKELLAKGLKVAKTQADTDKAYRDRDELRRKASSPTPAAPKQTVLAPQDDPNPDAELDDTVEPGEGEEIEPGELDDNPRGRSATGRDHSAVQTTATRAADQHIDQMSEALALSPAETRQLKVGVRQAIADALKQLKGNTAPAADPRVTTQLATARGLATEVSQALAQERCESAKERLIEKFPGLADPAEYDAVVQALAATDTDLSLLKGPRDKFFKAFEGAAWARFGPQVERSVKQSLLAENARARQGQPIADSVRPSAKPISDADWDDNVLAIMEQNPGDTAAQQKAIEQLKRRSVS